MLILALKGELREERNGKEEDWPRSKAIVASRRKKKKRKEDKHAVRDL